MTATKQRNRILRFGMKQNPSYSHKVNTVNLDAMLDCFPGSRISLNPAKSMLNTFFLFVPLVSALCLLLTFLHSYSLAF